MSKDKITKTFEWLYSLSTKHIPGVADTYNPYKGKVIARYGRLYSLNGYILASVELSGYEHIGDDEWKEISIEKRVDDNGKVSEISITGNFTEIHPRDSKFFENFFIKQLHYDCVQPFNPRFISECMKPFIINNLFPVISQDGHYLEFSAHNADISIRVLMVGCGVNM